MSLLVGQTRSPSPKNEVKELLEAPQTGRFSPLETGTGGTVSRPVSVNTGQAWGQWDPARIIKIYLPSSCRASRHRVKTAAAGMPAIPARFYMDVQYVTRSHARCLKSI